MSNLKSVIKFWTEFNLVSLQKSLDQTANEIALRQDDSECSKRNLIELTKEWKRSADEDVRNKVAQVIRAFQNEVDALNKRSKAAEGSFLSLYKMLLEVPDPVPVLRQAEAVKKQLEKAKDTELENLNLRKTLEEYHAEFAEVKNQEITLTRLREKVKELEDQAEACGKEKLQQKEKELEEKFRQKESELLNEQVQLAANLAEVEGKVRVLQEALKVAEAEAFDLKSKYEEASAGRIAEIEILETELERATQNRFTVAQSADAFRDQIQDSSMKGESHNAETVQCLEEQLVVKEHELRDVVEELHRSQSIISQIKQNASNQISALERCVSEKIEEICELNTRLTEQADYHEIKRELGILKMIEFSGLDVASDQFSDVKSLENLLLSKNRNLQSECSEFKVKNRDLLVKVGELQKECADAYYTIKEQKELISQLENDLCCVNGLSGTRRGEGDGQGSSSGDADVNLALQRAFEDSSFLGKINDNSLLPIISSQRERFRARNMELEAQIRNQQREISSLQNEVDTVRMDNVALYGKIKFLQSYPISQAASRVDINDDSLNRYSAQYEEKIDPFSVFSKKEQQRKYAGLSAPEKVTLNMGRFILSNKIARTLAFFYTVMLHCLVFLVLYKFAYAEQCQIDLANALRQEEIHRNIDSLAALSPSRLLPS